MPVLLIMDSFTDEVHFDQTTYSVLYRIQSLLYRIDNGEFSAWEVTDMGNDVNAFRVMVKGASAEHCMSSRSHLKFHLSYDM